MSAKAIFCRYARAISPRCDNYYTGSAWHVRMLRLVSQPANNISCAVLSGNGEPFWKMLNSFWEAGACQDVAGYERDDLGRSSQSPHPSYTIVPCPQEARARWF